MTCAQAAATVLRMDVLDTLFHAFAHGVSGEAIRDAQSLTLRPGILDATFARTHDSRTDAQAKEVTP